MTLRGHLDRFRRPLAVLLFGALFLRALVPAGWMPSEGSGFRIELCAEWGGPAASAHAAEAQRRFDAAVQGSRGHDRDGDASAKDQPCAFAGLGLAWAPADVPAPLQPVVSVDATPVSERGTVRIGQGLAAPPPPATGPPLLA